MKKLLLMLMITPALTFAQGQLNTPSDGSVQSGSNVIEGYHCDADMASELYAIIDDTIRVDMLFPFERRGTQGVCGHTMTGFMVQYFWARLDDGAHTMTMYIDGVEFDSTTFRTVSLGSGFVTPSAPPPTRVQDFPEPGRTTLLCWSESAQDFNVCGVQDSNTPRLRTERLIGGTWLMMYTILTDWTDQYTCNGPAEPNTGEAGGWIVRCNDQFGLQRAVGAWLIEAESYAIVRRGTIIDQQYEFTLDANDIITDGCYWQYSHSADRWSRCYDLTGLRLTTKATISAGDPLDAEWQREIETGDKAEADPRAARIHELLP